MEGKFVFLNDADELNNNEWFEWVIGQREEKNWLESRVGEGGLCKQGWELCGL